MLYSENCNFYKMSNAFTYNLWGITKARVGNFGSVVQGIYGRHFSDSNCIFSILVLSSQADILENLKLK